MERLSPELLALIPITFDYNPASGDLIWRPRPKDYFVSESAWNRWTKRYSGAVVNPRQVWSIHHLLVTLPYKVDVSRGPRPLMETKGKQLVYPRVIYWLMREVWIYDTAIINYLDGDFKNTSWLNLQLDGEEPHDSGLS